MPLISSLIKGVGSGIGLAAEGKNIRIPKTRAEGYRIIGSPFNSKSPRGR